MDPSYLIVGDVHGCVDELRALLELAGAGRQVVFVGDLVAKGPASGDVVQLARELGAQSVLGNHDHRLLRWHEACAAGARPPLLGPDHRLASEQLGDADFTWLAALPYYVALPGTDVIVVHAGLVPGVPLTDQRADDMLAMRTIRPDGTASKHLADGVPWARLWRGPPHVVFGHDAVRGLQEHQAATGLDTGCVYGGRLTGLLLPERRVLDVPSQRRGRP